ncbi:3-deoxy-D-manno-octulosonic acid transferase [Rhodocytophaga rosea]|uniref:3-deoxy-D-manno-octulosonic acid transferase n=1 Tax=Rhodocytophaga rosea TaxID=2704465 RepID=A0A6C0GJJ1_9BACT|nr:glycosyltransferase N-terminal domain-containing protein [Rhodocytophaga rosea]QHT68241.1 3-deoxy-D-manno-octulosonic acid transferase [Rhodocytophaga rosea]
MSRLLYSVALQIYGLLIHLVALWNPKAKQWINGRKHIFERITNAFQGNTLPVAWFHAASLGEFEQARPVIEQFRKEFPDYKILLTFFSPSGYEVRKNYPGADYIFYMPLDTTSHARTFIKLVQPAIVFFAKYEFWYHYLNELKRANIPVISFSAIFRKEQVFFKSYGGFFRSILRNFEHIFVQNQMSAALLQSISIQQTSVAGDTRFDRVQTIASQKKDLPLIASFKQDKKLVVIGSSWPQDMHVLLPFLNSFIQPLKVIIAPHEIHEAEIVRLQEQIRKKSVRFSQAQKDDIASSDVLIIDNIGMLSSLYQYGEFAYIGGAFGKGLHNILEAATFGMPIFFGPHYHRFQEAVDLIASGGAVSVNNSEEFGKHFTNLYEHEEERLQKAEVSRQYVASRTGATQKIMAYTHQLLSGKSA